MDNNGQLTFSDDPLLNESNKIFQLIEEGNFTKSMDLLDKLMSINPDYPGLIDSYRATKFWMNREKELSNLTEGKKTADFLMTEWSIFDEYAKLKKIESSTAFKSVMKYIFFTASQHYKTAFKKQEDTSSNFDLLLKLGDCFLRLEEYQKAIDTLEYARNSYKSNACLLSILAEANYQLKDYPKSLLYFREAFFVNPTDINMELLKSKPVQDLIALAKNDREDYKDIREWIPVYGFISDIFYVRRNLSKHQVNSIKKDIYSLEISFQKMDTEQKLSSNTYPRLINKYLWMLDYYKYQNNIKENIDEIKERLLKIENNMFVEYFKDY